MIEFDNMDAADDSTFACIAFVKCINECIVRVTPRNKWLHIAGAVTLILRQRMTGAPYAHATHVSYRELVIVLRENGESDIARALVAQLRSAASPTHSHAPANWRPPVRVTKTQLPAYHDYKDFPPEKPAKRKRKKSNSEPTTAD